MPDVSLLGLGQGGILVHFYSPVTLGALDSFFSRTAFATVAC